MKLFFFEIIYFMIFYLNPVFVGFINGMIFKFNVKYVKILIIWVVGERFRALSNMVCSLIIKTTFILALSFMYMLTLLSFSVLVRCLTFILFRFSSLFQFLPNYYCMIILKSNIFLHFCKIMLSLNMFYTPFPYYYYL